MGPKRTGRRKKQRYGKVDGKNLPDKGFVVLEGAVGAYAHGVWRTMMGWLTADAKVGNHHDEIKEIEKNIHHLVGAEHRRNNRGLQQHEELGHHAGAHGQKYVAVGPLCGMAAFSVNGMPPNALCPIGLCFLIGCAVSPRHMAVEPGVLRVHGVDAEALGVILPRRGRLGQRLRVGKRAPDGCPTSDAASPAAKR